jgi:hypothetical protein
MLDDFVYIIDALLEVALLLQLRQLNQQGIHSYQSPRSDGLLVRRGVPDFFICQISRRKTSEAGLLFSEPCCTLCVNNRLIRGSGRCLGVRVL